MFPLDKEQSVIIKERGRDNLVFKDLLATWKVKNYRKLYQWKSTES